MFSDSDVVFGLAASPGRLETRFAALKRASQ